jgi:hypothetical protein
LGLFSSERLPPVVGGKVRRGGKKETGSKLTPQTDALQTAQNEGRGKTVQINMGPVAVVYLEASDPSQVYK